MPTSEPTQATVSDPYEHVEVLVGHFGEPCCGSGEPVGTSRLVDTGIVEMNAVVSGTGFDSNVMFSVRGEVVTGWTMRVGVLGAADDEFVDGFGGDGSVGLAPPNTEKAVVTSEVESFVSPLNSQNIIPPKLSCCTYLHFSVIDWTSS
jgi:hypothetical protein